jgi:transposase-like protein
VRGDVHTQTIESVWSLLKRSIVGSYHHVSVKHLDSYVDELEWRQNNRENPFLFRETMRKLVTAEALPYRELIE